MLGGLLLGQRKGHATQLASASGPRITWFWAAPTETYLYVVCFDPWQETPKVGGLLTGEFFVKSNRNPWQTGAESFRHYRLSLTFVNQHDYWPQLTVINKLYP